MSTKHLDGSEILISTEFEYTYSYIFYAVARLALILSKIFFVSGHRLF